MISFTENLNFFKIFFYRKFNFFMIFLLKKLNIFWHFFSIFKYFWQIFLSLKYFPKFEWDIFNDFSITVLGYYLTHNH